MDALRQWFDYLLHPHGPMRCLESLYADHKRAGVKPWLKLFHNLRASRETKLATEYPIHVVCAWIGNTERIAAKHYLQVYGGLLRARCRIRCSKLPYCLARTRQKRRKPGRNRALRWSVRHRARRCKMPGYPQGDSKDPGVSGEDSRDPRKAAQNPAQLGPDTSRIDPDLARIIVAWPARTRRRPEAGG